MSKWLDKLHDGAATIVNISVALDRLADGFEITGNMTLAQKLYHMSARLEKTANEIRSGAGEAVTEQLNRSQESTNNMLLAALASTAQTLEATGNKTKAKVVAKTGVALTTITGKKIPKKRPIRPNRRKT